MTETSGPCCICPALPIRSSFLRMHCFGDPLIVSESEVVSTAGREINVAVSKEPEGDHLVRF